jgi:magnesium-transporting ATPase (P-type)
MAPKKDARETVPLSGPAHALSHRAVAEELGADTANGLSAVEAKSRLERYGRNELDDGPGVQPFKILIHQVANAMMLVKPP